jgi:hypothetical protein
MVYVLPQKSPCMDSARPRPRPEDFTERVPHSRAELLRYFAWGYLSRRELNERLKSITLAPQEMHSAA